MERRDFIKAFLGSSAAAVIGVQFAGAQFSAVLGLAEGPFQYGVASGDPLPNGIIIWTRVTPSSEAIPGSLLGAATSVDWIVASNASLSNVVASGTVVTNAASDHTVKVDVTGLSPATSYYYGFKIGTVTSTIGRCKTAPAADADNQQVRFGFVSCSNYTHGYFAAYRCLAGRNDLDFVLHVGDYIYEYGDGGYGSFRPLDPATEIVSLSDYRKRFAIYRSDPDLAAVHARHPFITTIDDHEITNDAWANGAQNHQPGTEGDYITRRNRAMQVYFEWMPIRTTLPAVADETRIYRALRFGTLADLSMLDLRQYRSQQPTTFAESQLPERTMTGAEQYTWLQAQLTKPTAAKWQLIGNSVQMMNVKYPVQFGFSDGAGTFRNPDAWDGYVAQRTELLTFIGANDNNFDVVFFTGDIHSTWAADLRLDFNAPTTPSVATEFVCTSVTSDNLNEILSQAPRNATSLQIEAGIQALNPHIKLIEFDSHGFSVVDVSPTRVQTDWYYLSDRQDANASCSLGFSRQTMAGEKTISATLPTGPIVDNVGPDPVIPEVPLNVLLPLTAAAVVVGGAVALRRRTEPTEIPTLALSGHGADTDLG